jgi:sirohydrochlorin cobaltochelatase
MTPRVLILFAHGARDPRWAQPFQRLQAIIREQRPQARVELGFLELMSPRLPELVEQLLQEGLAEMTIVPVFFGQGGHLLRDLPAMVSELREAHPDLQLDVAPAVGEDAQVLQAIARYCLGHIG